MLNYLQLPSSVCGAIVLTHSVDLFGISWMIIESSTRASTWNASKACWVGLVEATVVNDLSLPAIEHAVCQWSKFFD